MKIFDSLLTADIRKRKVFSVFLTIMVSIPLILWCIYGVGDYGIALFVLIPFLVGLLSTTILWFNNPITTRQARHIGFLTLFILAFGLMVFAIEGLICIIMAAPFAIVLTWLGSAIGHFIISKYANHSVNSIIILLIIIPLTAFTEKVIIPEVKPVTTSVIIDAKVETIWKNVIEFPKLNQPDELIFNLGISYPIESVIDGDGEGAIRYCKFNTGEFVEPITLWRENELLEFDVIEQPVPLKEISFWDINSPHLHDYFVSKKGQFKITKLEDDKVKLEGTT